MSHFAVNVHGAEEAIATVQTHRPNQHEKPFSVVLIEVGTGSVALYYDDEDTDVARAKARLVADAINAASKWDVQA